MFALVNGKPIFYIGKVNGMGYVDKTEKDEIIKELKEDNPNIEIEEEDIEINNELKEKAMELGELNLTYSKSEFMKYLNGEKPIPGLEVEKLKKDNKLLSEGIVEIALLSEQRSIENELAITELANILGGLM